MNPLIKGSCLCGSVTYEVNGPFKVFQYCHCSRCRKFTGSAHSANAIVAREQVTWLSGDENIGRYNLPGTKYFATCFCRVCGSSLPWTEQSGKNIIIPAGTLDSDPGVKPNQSLFWGSRACWYESVDQLPKYDTLPGK